jgi:hypothetical protein
MPEQHIDPEDESSQPDMFDKNKNKEGLSELFAAMLKKKNAEDNQKPKSSMTTWLNSFIEQAEGDSAEDNPELDHIKSMLPMLEHAEREQAERDSKINLALELLKKLVDNTSIMIEEIKKLKP